MLTVFFRTTLLFALTVLVIRAMGKRQLAQLQPFEVVITLMIAELAAVPMGDVGISLFSGVVSILTLLFLHSLITIFSFRSERFRAFICGKPSVLIRKGKIQLGELERLCFDLNDLIEGIRSQGILNIADVDTALLETNGTLTAFQSAASRPVTPTDLNLTTDYEGIPLILVLDGAVQREALRLGGFDESWLQKTLASLGFEGPKDVLLCSLDTQGRIYVQSRKKDGRLCVRQVLKPEQVRW